MDYIDPFPRPFRSMIAKNIKRADKQKSSALSQSPVSAPWPNIETLPLDVLETQYTPGWATLEQGTTAPHFNSNEFAGTLPNLENQSVSLTTLANMNGSTLPYGSTRSCQAAGLPEVYTNTASSIHAPNSIEKHINGKQRIFPCTFCRQSFKNKYDWTRHEKSLHLDLEAWTCAPESGIMNCPSTGNKHCVYCNQLDPTPEHLDEHNHSACVGMERTFSRKDHLVQHLRLVHRLKEVPSLHYWRGEAPPFICTCGFCGHQLRSWGERTDHLAAHFREGATMRDWRGEHGFSPAIATQVRNANVFHSRAGHTTEPATLPSLLI